MIAPADVSQQSCLYHGKVHHARRVPFEHSFRYSLFMAYLDLAEAETIFDRYWLWSTRRPAVAWFRRRDHFGDSNASLDQCVRELVAKRLEIEPTGPIRLLTQLRYFGYVINPVSFYYCFDETDSRVEAVVAEVTNTPWGETHLYVLPGSDDGTVIFEHGKAMHVSPFMPMDLRYHWQVSMPGSELKIGIQNSRGDEQVFDASMSMKRREITSANLARALVRHPFMTGKVFAAIYWQALRLKLRGAKFFPHPNKTTSTKPGQPERSIAK